MNICTETATKNLKNNKFAKYHFFIFQMYISKINLQFVTVCLVSLALALDAELFRGRVLIRQIDSLSSVNAKRR